MTYASLANYDNERSLFTQLITTDTKPNILLFQGESGSGKSHLIEHCVNSVPDTPSVLMKLQSGSDSIPTLFNLMGRQQSWQQLPYFTRTVANLLEQPEKLDDAIWQMGMHRHLHEVGRISDLESRLYRYQVLTDAWFADALTFEKPFLIAIDGYENRSTLFDRWFNEDFLVGVANSSHMRVLVGGQTVPALREAWSFCASVQKLTGVHEAKAWLVWAEQAGYQIPSLELMTGVVIALKGNPSQIIEVIKTQFPRTVGPIKSKESIREQRKRTRENVMSAFTLPELKDICFDMEIAWENLPDHNILNGFVRELLGYVDRVGRLHELIQVLQSERPHLEW